MKLRAHPFSCRLKSQSQSFIHRPYGVASAATAASFTDLGAEEHHSFLSSSTTSAASHVLHSSPTIATYSVLLSRCAASQSLISGAQIHTHLAKSGLSSVYPLRNFLLSFYSRCLLPASAHKLFEEIPHPDVITWSALVSSYAHNGLPLDALLAFKRMHSSGVQCNEFTFPSILKACSSSSDLILGSQVHASVIISGFETNPFVANTLIVLYGGLGNVQASWKLFERICDRNVVSWNTLFSCYVQNDRCEEALGLFRCMLASGLMPNEYSLSCMLNACLGCEDLTWGKSIHGCLVKLGYDLDVYTANGLVDMYAKLGNFNTAAMVFGEIGQPNIVAWNAFIAGCVLHGHSYEALELLGKMKCSEVAPNMFTLSSCLKACAETEMLGLGQQINAISVKAGSDSDLYVGVGLVDMYSKCGRKEDARKAFDLIPDHDLVSWNALISGYSHSGHDKEALFFFCTMRREGYTINRTTLSAVLKSAASLQVLSASKQIHSLSIRSGFMADMHVSNGLIDAYGKCNCIEDARIIFEECSIKDVVSFTSMITAHSQSGQGEEALQLFTDMLDRGLKPDSFVCSSLFNACASLSSYEPGKQIHAHVVKLGSLPDVFVGNALVYMYAKCGSVEDANMAFSEIPERGIVSWSAMIGGLAQHGHGKEALELFNQMLKDGISPNHITLTSVLCACNHAGLVNEAKKYFKSMKQMFGVDHTQEHYACMVDLLGRAGRLDEAMELVNQMPFEGNAAIWGALLGASKVHKNLELGRRAAEKLFTLEPEKSGTHVLLANMYASAGRWDDVAEVRRMMKGHRLKKEPALSWIELKDKVHTFIVGDRNHSRTTEIYAKLDELNDLMYKAGYSPMIESDLHAVDRVEKVMLLSHHSERLAVALGLICTPDGAPIRVKKNLRICEDCHVAFKFICKIVSREIIIRDINRFHHFKDGNCSCGDYW